MIDWNNIADSAIGDLNARIEAVGRAASWDNPALTTWDNLNHSGQMELMRRKSQWGNLGKSEEQLINEIVAEMRAQGGR